MAMQLCFLTWGEHIFSETIVKNIPDGLIYFGHAHNMICYARCCFGGGDVIFWSRGPNICSRTSYILLLAYGFRDDLAKNWQEELATLIIARIQ